ncbi:DNA glycosylase [Corchorus olitorius]|uniref:DNA glycosylase n=1 Tax=Corchorus olitorius TaxID=93759 RepID=A0A1R3JIJ6_9ROSI|nr:DNA glycosylase [Corchorus olitorius]
MSPNDWNPITQSLRRPLRLADDSQSVDVTISHPSSNCAFLVIYVHDVQSLQSLPSADQAAILRKQNFPTSKEIACLDEKYLRDNCKLGYRAKPILQLAKKIETRKLDKLINKLEDQSSDITSYQESYEKLKKIKGFGTSQGKLLS